MRSLTFHLFVALLLFGGIQRTCAQDAKNGQLLSERRCSECRAIGSASDKLRKTPSFASIAAKETIDGDKIASLVLHGPMPNPPLTPKKARDIAQYIIKMKKKYSPRYHGWLQKEALQS